MRVVVLALLLVLGASSAVAQDWGNIATISSTLGNNTNQLCIGDHSRPGDIGCPTYAPSLTTAGDLTVSGSVTAAQFIGDGSGLTGVSANVSVTTGLSGSIVYRDQYGGLVASPNFSISSTTGSIGIGAGAPAWLGSNGLYASGSLYANALYLNGNSSMTWGSGNTKIAGSESPGYLTFTTSNTEAMRIVSSGYVGIGTSTPSNTLTVIGVPSYGVIDVIGNGTNYESSIGYHAKNVIKGGVGSWITGVNLSGTPTNSFSIFNSGKSLLTILNGGSTGINTITPTTALEVSGTISATNFVGNGSGLTGITASTDRIVSGSINAVADVSSGAVRVSGTLALNNTGSEPCDAAHWYTFRANPVTQQMQMCRP